MSSSSRQAAAYNSGKKALSSDEEKDSVRLIINQQGEICFAGHKIKTLLGLDNALAPYGAAEDALRFADPEQALCDRGHRLFGQDSRKDNAFIAALREGIHEICCSEGRRAHIHFTRIETAKGLIIIGSLVNPGEGGVIEYTQPEGNLTNWLKKKLPPQRAAGRKQEERNSDLSAEDIANFLDMSNDLMIACHKDGSLHKFNRNVLTLFGYPEKQLEKMTFTDIIHPEDKPDIRALLVKMLNGEAQTNQITDFEARMICRNGGIRHIEWRQKKFGPALYMVGHDITALKENERTLKRQRQQLAEAQSIGRMGHWTWTLGGQDLEFSKEVLRLFGIEDEAFTPTVEAVSKLVHRRDLGRTLQAFQRAMFDKRNFEMEFRIIPPQGNMRYIRCQGRCETDADGEVLSLFGIMQDITEAHMHESELRAAKEAAEHAYATKSQFLANMSHELRTPLNAIIGFSEMIERQLLGPIGTEKYLDYISGIRESGEHLLDLITDILDMSKIEAGKYELDIEEVHIVKLIRLAVHMMEGRALDDSITMEVDAGHEDLVVKVDRRAVMQIMLNLLSNAVKFTGKEGHIHIECIERETYIAVKIHDNGIGIPASKISAITRPFEQVSNQYSRGHAGSGLGLAITKELAELHGGALHIESALGEGTCVTIRLPYDATMTRQDRAIAGNQLN